MLLATKANGIKIISLVQNIDKNNINNNSYGEAGKWEYMVNKREKKTCNLLTQTNRVEVNIRKEHIAWEHVSDLCIYIYIFSNACAESIALKMIWCQSAKTWNSLHSYGSYKRRIYMFTLAPHATNIKYK